MVPKKRKQPSAVFVVVAIGIALFLALILITLSTTDSGSANTDIFETEPLVGGLFLLNFAFWPWALAYLAAINRRNSTAWFFAGVFLFVLSPICIPFILRTRESNGSQSSSQSLHWKPIWFAAIAYSFILAIIHPLLFLLGLVVFLFVWWKIMQILK